MLLQARSVTLAGSAARPPRRAVREGPGSPRDWQPLQLCPKQICEGGFGNLFYFILFFLFGLLGSREGRRRDSDVNLRWSRPCPDAFGGCPCLTNKVLDQTLAFHSVSRCPLSVALVAATICEMRGALQFTGTLWALREYVVNGCSPSPLPGRLPASGKLLFIHQKPSPGLSVSFLYRLPDGSCRNSCFLCTSSILPLHLPY